MSESPTPTLAEPHDFLAMKALEHACRGLSSALYELHWGLTMRAEPAYVAERERLVAKYRSEVAAALDAPQQEPDGWRWRWKSEGVWGCWYFGPLPPRVITDLGVFEKRPLYDRALPPGEPTAPWMAEIDFGGDVGPARWVQTAYAFETREALMDAISPHVEAMRPYRVLRGYPKGEPAAQEQERELVTMDAAPEHLATKQRYAWAMGFNAALTAGEPAPTSEPSAKKHTVWEDLVSGSFVKCAACGYKWNRSTRISCESCDADGIAEASEPAAVPDVPPREEEK